MHPSQVREDTWSQLLERVGQKRDESAFQQLFKHFEPLIKGFCVNQGGVNYSADFADEIVQEVMIKVWQKAPYFDPSKAAASTWIYTVMRNCRIDLLRKNQRHQITDGGSLEVDDLWDETTENQPFVYLQHSRNEDLIRQSFESLPVEQRQALTQVYMQGKTHSEIAEASGLPLGTVKSRVRMGLQKLQQSISRW